MSKRRPRLIFNGRLIREFQAAATPCGILGQLEENGSLAPFLAIRLEQPLDGRTGTPLKFGHALLGERHGEVMQFGVTFFERSTYHLLVNPNNPTVRTILDRVLEKRYYFVFVINLTRWTTAFRAELTAEGLERLAEYRRHLRGSSTSEAQYRQTVAQFARNPTPPGCVLEWVCRHDSDYLDLTEHRLELHPAH